MVFDVAGCGTGKLTVPVWGGIVRRDPIDQPLAVKPLGGENAIFRARARRLGLSFTSQVDLGPNPYTSIEAIDTGLFAMSAGGGMAYLAPPEPMMADIAQWLRLNPTARPRVAITTPTAVRAALRQAGRHRYGAEALHRLEAIDTDVSAKRVVTGRQVSIAAALIMILVGALVAAPIATLIVIDLIAATFFLSVSLLRFAAAGRVPRRLPRPLLPARDKRDLPTYTILIPLLQEAHLVAELVEAMDAIDWPRDRLDIKLIVEEGDLPTRAAAVRLTNGTPYEVIIVPAIGPQTKPKALQYGLIFARGSFVTVFDAEDRPDPQQLREAYATFCRCEGDIACLQAPLLVDNPDASWLSRSFAVEYSGLFDGLLSALSRFRLPLPLGGTSNHFRRDVLEAVGGWDPYNVTEDADLGIRLARNGYRAATLTLPTYEEAPARLWPWIKQRSRWFKGWMQTWLVHMRHPIQLAKDLGIRQFLGFNLIGLGMIVSAIAHPIFVATPILLMRNPIGLWDQAGTLTAVVVGINIFNLIAGYLAVWVLSLRTTRLRRRFPILPALLGLPLYWLLMALACLRAAVQLVIRPHAWEKTPHVGQRGRTRRPAHPAPRRVWPAVTQPDTR